MQDNENLRDAFIKTKRYPYTPSQLNFLTEKTGLFLLNHLQEIFKNRGKSKIHQKKKIRILFSYYERSRRHTYR